MGIHCQAFLEDLELSFDYIMNKMMKRSNLEISIHSASSNHSELKAQLTILSSRLKDKYRRSFASPRFR